MAEFIGYGLFTMLIVFGIIGFINQTRTNIA